MKRILLTLIFISILLITGWCDEEVKVIEVNAGNFKEEVLESKVPVVIDFYATWCKPCKRMSVIIERLAAFHKNKVKFVKVDVDKNRKFLNNFRPLRGLPLLLFYKDGKEVDRTLGLIPFTTANSKIIPLLKKEKKEKKEKDCKGGVCPPPEGY